MALRTQFYYAEPLMDWRKMEDWLMVNLALMCWQNPENFFTELGMIGLIGFTLSDEKLQKQFEWNSTIQPNRR